MSISKYYVVWDGASPGSYASWTECRLQVQNYPGAKYKGFASQEEAAAAFRKGMPLNMQDAMPLPRNHPLLLQNHVLNGFSIHWPTTPRVSVIPG